MVRAMDGLTRYMKSVVMVMCADQMQRNRQNSSSAYVWGGQYKWRSKGAKLLCLQGCKVQKMIKYLARHSLGISLSLFYISGRSVCFCYVRVVKMNCRGICL